MNILSFSDVHGDLQLFDFFLEKIEDISFDVIVIAGDIGDEQESKIMVNKLAQYGKPILYVLGNWDTFSYQTNLHASATHLHLNHVKYGEWVFLGFSGCAVDGYRRNPSIEGSYDEYYSNKRQYKRKYGSYNNYCKSIIINELKAYIIKHEIDVDDLILVAHERLYALPFTPFMHIFGHRHQPKLTYHKGIYCLNTSAIERQGRHLPLDQPGNFCICQFNNMTCQIDFHEVPAPYIRTGDTEGFPHLWQDSSGKWHEDFFKRRPEG